MPKLTAEATTALYLRLPPALKEQLRRESVRVGRTLNAEVVRRLEVSLEEKP